MTRATRLKLNLFGVNFSEDEISLPHFEFESYERSGEFLKKIPLKIRAHRTQKQADEAVRIYMLSGDYDPKTFVKINLSGSPYLALDLIRSGLSDYFRNRNFLVQEDRFSLQILEQAPCIEREAALIRRGISITPRHPFDKDVGHYAIAVTWLTPAEFKTSLKDEILKEMALGRGVIFRPNRPKSKMPKELSTYRNKFLGTVREFSSELEAIVYCKDHSTRLLPLDELYLEANPNTLAEYDKRLGGVGPSLWSKILTLNHTLTDKGRRNTTVLRDRLSSIQKFLGNGNKQTLAIPVSPLSSISIAVNLSPLEVEVI